MEAVMSAPWQVSSPCVWGTGPVPAAQSLALAFRAVMAPHLPLVTIRSVARSLPESLQLSGPAAAAAVANDLSQSVSSLFFFCLLCLAQLISKGSFFFPPPAITLFLPELNEN